MSSHSELIGIWWNFQCLEGRDCVCLRQQRDVEQAKRQDLDPGFCRQGPVLLCELEQVT